MDAREFLIKKREYCKVNTCNNCKFCDVCTPINSDEKTIDEQIKFIESQPIKCHACGHPVNIVDGVYKQVEHNIDAERVARMVNELFAYYRLNLTNDKAAIYSAVTQAIEEELKS